MLNVLQYAANKAGNVLLQNFRKNIVVSQKGSPKNIVTEADEASQAIIKQTILDYFKTKGIDESEIGFIGEEHLNKSGEHIFIIDPLDGTNNYASGIDYFAVSIAYFYNNELISAVVHNPIRRISYVAEKKTGAFFISESGKKKLQIKPISMKKVMLISHTTSDPVLRKRVLEIFDNIVGKILAIRIYGASVLDICSLTENHNHAVIYPGDYIWDFAACKLIIKEAGGVLTDWKGKEITFNFKDPKKRYQLVACHPKILPEILKYVG